MAYFSGTPIFFHNKAILHISKGVPIWHFCRYADTPILVIADMPILPIFAYARISYNWLDLHCSILVSAYKYNVYSMNLPRGFGLTCYLLILVGRFLQISESILSTVLLDIWVPILLSYLAAWPRRQPAITSCKHLLLVISPTLNKSDHLGTTQRDLVTWRSIPPPIYRGGLYTHDTKKGKLIFSWYLPKSMSTHHRALA